MAAADFLSWLVETTLATSALFLLVLIIRRPVARRFGAEAAYLLWLAPALRFVAPDLAVLPAPVEQAFSSALAVPAATASSSISTTSVTAPTGSFGEAYVLPLLLLWAAGAVAFAAFQFGAQVVFSRRMRASSTPAPAPVMAEASTVAWRSRMNSPMSRAATSMRPARRRLCARCNGSIRWRTPPGAPSAAIRKQPATRSSCAAPPTVRMRRKSTRKRS